MHRTHFRTGLVRVAIIAWLILPLPTASRSAPLQESPSDRTEGEVTGTRSSLGVDSLGLSPESLRAAFGVETPEMTYRELVSLLRERHRLNVLFDFDRLDAEGISDDSPIVPGAPDEPLCLVLDRQRERGVHWYFESNIVRLTSRSGLEEHRTTEVVDLSDRVADDEQVEGIARAITATIERDSWDEVGGYGVLRTAGRALVVTQHPLVHRKIRGLLAALHGDSPMTYVDDQPAHESLRRALAADISIDVDGVELAEAIDRLETAAAVTIELDLESLDLEGVSSDTPVTLQLNETPLETVAKALLPSADVTIVPRHGRLMLTSRDNAQQELALAVLDVRDLAIDDSATDALRDLIVAQRGDSWSDYGGLGEITAPLPGRLVIAADDETLREVERLIDQLHDMAAKLAMLRAADPKSASGRLFGDDPTEVITRFYRVETTMAADVARLLPQLVAEGTWQSETHPDRVGSVTLAGNAANHHGSSFITSSGQIVDVSSSDDAEPIPHSIVIIRQTRQVHREIGRTLSRLYYGDRLIGFDGSSTTFGGPIGPGGFMRLTPGD
ncbi:MAG TPA: hypothetical protein PLI18_19470 [Pirellulaceae bacterium]|nr:hypothetical protein [Pirellulaceae bacterium]